MNTIDDWMELLQNLCENTEYEAVKNGARKKNNGVAIVSKNSKGPQRICVYPKKTKGPGMVVEMDIYNTVISKLSFPKYARIKSGRPHYNDLTDDMVISVCKIFLRK